MPEKGNDDDDDMRNIGEWADGAEEKDVTLWNWKLEWVT